jgi:serine/threonine protein kinase/Flp pilus assembly protein TadD
MGAIVDEFLERLEHDPRPDVEEYARRYPPLATVLRQMLPALQAVHAPARDRPAAGERPAAGTGPEERLGDFRIVREIGRGGMGVVYEAVQVSLGRRVALKVLPFAGALDGKHLQRFQNEAQAAAHLHHPNIVPVYFVGCERGVHYYAMQLIEGQTLAAVIHELRRWAGAEPEGPAGPREPVSEFVGGLVWGPGAPEPSGIDPCGPSAALAAAHPPKDPAFFRTAAGLAVQAARALEHAHQLGVVHRDVKPANLLVDGQGKVWVTDFGLAQVQNDTRLTRTGDVMGTLRYMSPEQALAQPAGVNHRTDLYSLGATLYELLTLAPTFTGRDRHELLRQIAFEEPRPLRRVNPSVPADLETIVLTAMAKDPAERYATAQELADDLERFVKDEPIRARRPTLAHRGRRWARRHQTLVWAAALSLLAALAVLAASAGWIVRDRSARRAKFAADLQVALKEAQEAQREGHLARAQAAAQRAEGLLEEGAAEPDLAGQVRNLLGELAEEEADRRLVARLEELRLLQAEVNVEESRFVLERALPDYRQAFRERGLWEDMMTAEEAAAHLRGRPAKVRGTLLTALDHCLILARFQKAPEEGWLRQVLSAADTDTWRQRVRAARERNDRPALEQLAREVDVAAQPPEALFLLDISLRQRGARESAVALLRRAQEVFPGDFWINHDLGLALLDCQPPRCEDAVRFLTAAVALRPSSPGVRLNLGCAFEWKGRPEEAAAAYRQAVTLRPDYAMAHHSLGRVLRKRGEFAQALAAHRQGFALDPKRAEDLKAGHRFDAACAAARVAAGEGKDAGPLDDGERSRWRRQALEWLRADLAACAKLLEGGRPEDLQLTLQRLRHFRDDPDLASLSEPAALARLPADEEEAWGQFWAEVRALLGRAGAARWAPRRSSPGPWRSPCAFQEGYAQCPA